MAEAARVRRETVAAAESAVEAAATAAAVKASASTARPCERQSAGGQQ
jgi:hypothetical protein